MAQPSSPPGYGLTAVTTDITDRNDWPVAVMVLVRGRSGEGACPSPDYRNKLLLGHLSMDGR